MSIGFTNILAYSYRLQVCRVSIKPVTCNLYKSIDGFAVEIIKAKSFGCDLLLLYILL